MQTESLRTWHSKHLRDAVLNELQPPADLANHIRKKAAERGIPVTDEFIEFTVTMIAMQQGQCIERIKAKTQELYARSVFLDKTRAAALAVLGFFGITTKH